jgi:2-desacetyl-2-hydroxyethyl bacteriochlorophyllide A dehydrogenase
MLPAMSSRLKDILNAQASRRLSQLGYSGARAADAKREAWWWAVARGQALARRRGLVGGWGIVWTDVGKAELVPIEVPRPGPGEVTVAILASAVSSGTERAQYLRLPNARVGYPHMPGYSAAGTVAMVGRDVTDLADGDRVAVRGAPHASVATLSRAAVHVLPDDVAIEHASLIQLGVICNQGVRRARIEPGESVAVVGSGPIGALTQRLARGDTSRLTVLARSSEKKETALRAGADAFIATGEDKLAAEDLSADVVFDTTGDPDALALAVRATAVGGRIVLLGSPRGTTRALPVEEIRAKRLRLIGAHVETVRLERPSEPNPFRRDGDEFLSALADRRISVDDLVELAVDPREADVFYRDLASGRVVSGARFDWTLLAADGRVRRSRFLRLPELRARGVDADQAAEPVARSVGIRRSWEPQDPFADAVGELRIGLVGCGDIATHNAIGISLAPNATLSACYDPVAELAAELALEHGAAVTATVEEMLARADVDAIFLAVPHHLHAPLAITAAEAGKHVIVEKPLANTLAGAKQMVEAADRAGVVLSVAFPHRYEPHAVAARRLVLAGALGDVGGTLVKYFADKPASYWLGGFSGRTVSSWRSSREQAGGGVLIMNISHLLDLVRHVTGLEVDTCTAATATLDGPAEVEDTVSLTLRYENGAIGALFGSSALRGNRGGSVEVHAWGRDGSLELEPSPRVYTTRAADGLRTTRWNSLAGFPTRDLRAVYVSRLASAITRGEEPDITAADGLAVQALIEAAYRSSDDREPVRPLDLLLGKNGP